MENYKINVTDTHKQEFIYTSNNIPHINETISIIKKGKLIAYRILVVNYLLEKSQMNDTDFYEKFVSLLVEEIIG